MQSEKAIKEPTQEQLFSGNIFIFQAFDVGDDINLEAIGKNNIFKRQRLAASKYFKNYHVPLTIIMDENPTEQHRESIQIHNFGALSIQYKIPFRSTLAHLRKHLEQLDDQFQEKSITDARQIFNKIQPYIKKPTFFQMQSSYLVIQVDPDISLFTDMVHLKQKYGSMIASMLRFETEALSEIQRDEILESAIGYYRGDLIVIDTSASFVYDSEYADIIDFFEFANIQHLELRYFDKVLDHLLNAIYEEKVGTISPKVYLPFIGTLSKGPVDELSKLRVDISVVTERLESSIKLVAEPYYSELYCLLQDKLDLKNWREGIERKLSIVQDIRTILQHKVDGAREDILSVLVVILIMFEVLVALLRAH